MVTETTPLSKYHCVGSKEIGLLANVVDDRVLSF